MGRITVDPIEAIRDRLSKMREAPDLTADDFYEHAEADIAWLLEEVRRLRNDAGGRADTSKASP